MKKSFLLLAIFLCGCKSDNTFYLNRINESLSTKFVLGDERIQISNKQGYNFFQVEIIIKLNKSELINIIEKNKYSLDYLNSKDDLFGREHYAKTIRYDENIYESITIFIDSGELYYKYNEK